MSYITCQDLTLGYEGQAIADGIEFKIDKGDYLCIIGENGAGKSTLMKTLLHLQQPMSGEIIYGEDLSPYEVGYLPQQTEVQRDFPASVYEIVLSGALSHRGLHPFFTKKEKDIVRENMEKLNIWNLRKSCYRELSGGQQQRVLLARALTATSKLLLLDEPVAGLDPAVTAELYHIVKELNDEGITIVMISHDIQAALTYATHILHMGRGQLFYGDVQTYETSEVGKRFCRNSLLGEEGGR